ncbi:hypothetical protein [Nonomuraea sp. KM90]|uniref:hypothetical protein n=1 Tax=Nonomuraea sp. KM90 TaxID=3457428 RepID=UPI003FCDDD97
MPEEKTLSSFSDWTAASGRSTVRLNGSGSLTLDFGDGAFDVDDLAADDLASALAEGAAAARRRRLPC